MARQVLPWVGMAVGAMVGAPQIGFMVGSLIGNAIDPQVINGPKLGEGQDNNASEGGYRPIVLGKGAVGVCMIHEGPLKKRTIRHKQSKGGGPVTTEERAYRTMAFALGESAYPDTGVQLARLWIDNKLRYDVTPTSQIVAESAEFADEFTFYPGTNDQQPDPDIEAFMGAGNVPSYRGGSPYIVFPDWDVTDSRGMAPMIKAELISSAVVAMPPQVYAASLAAANNGIIDLSNDGNVFDGTLDSGLGTNVTRIYAAGGALFMFSGVSAGRVTFDRGATTHEITGLEPSMIQINDVVHFRDDIGDVWILVSQNGLARSTNGRTFATVSVPNRTRYTGAAAGGVIVIGGTNRNVTVSFNRGNTFSEHTIPSDGVSTVGVDCVVHTGTGFLCGTRASERFRFSSSGAEGTWSFVDTGYASPTISGMGLGAFGDEAVSASGGESTYSNNHGTVFVAGDPAPIPLQSKIVGNELGFFYGISANIGNPSVSRYLGNGQWALSDYDKGNAWVASLPADLHVVTGTKIPLSSIVSWIHDRVGLPSTKADTSGLQDLVEGIVFSDGYTAADAIRTQMALYFFDAGEFDAGSGYRLNYVKRGGAASVTLTEADIVDGPEDWEREDSYERPRALHVAYQNPVADYGAPNITIKRTSPDVLVVGERSASVPNVFSDVDEITQRADVMMTVIYSEIAGTYEITLPVSWLALAPTDCIGFSIRGRTRRLRLTDWRFSPDGTIKTEWMADRQSAYTSNVTGLPVVPTTPPPPSIVGPTVSAVLDIPALVDALDSLHVVLAASGQTEAWYGSIHQRKLPSDADFATMAQFSAPTTIMGLLEVAVSAASPHYTDTTNVVRVKLYSDDDLDTYTQQQFLSEHGAFALAWDDGGVRRWEVCQYRDATKVGDMEWELATLLRGRLNTEAEAHPIGSMFVLLDSGIRVAPAQSSWIGQDITHRAVSNGQLPDNAVPYVETYTGESQREWPVAHVILNMVGTDLSVDIVPRHRFGTDDHPVRSLNWDGYRIEATDGVNSTTMTTASDTATIDVTGWSGTITVTVAQLNRIMGEGPAVSEVIE